MILDKFGKELKLIATKFSTFTTADNAMFVYFLKVYRIFIDHYF